MNNTAMQMDFSQEMTLEAERNTALAKAKEMQIFTGDDYLEAKGFWAQIRILRGKVKESYQPLIDQAHRLHKDAIAKRDEFDKPLEDAEKAIKKALAGYDEIQEKKRREEEARLREIARKAEEDRRLEEAAALERMGMKEQANQIIDAPVNVPTPALPKPERQAGDPVFRTVWKFRVTNPDLVPREYLKIDDVKIGGVVRALKENTNIPGIEVFSERV